MFQVRKWLKRLREKRKIVPLWQRPPGLNDARRLELQTVIQERRENNTVRVAVSEHVESA
jgi:transposase